MINKELILTKEYLKECLDYNPVNGFLVWKERPLKHFNDGARYTAQVICDGWNKRYVGVQTGWEQKNNNSGKFYKCAHINGYTYMAHRIIWFYMTGEWPDKIDHKDGNGLNNVWTNLRDVDDQENQKNKKLYHCNKSGISGVYYRYNRWRAVIRHKSHLNSLGHFKDFFEACCARKSAENKYGFHQNHGANRPQ